MFFFEKKNQKTFISLRTLPASRARTVKSFLLLFFKKEDLSYLLSAKLGSRPIPGTSLFISATHNAGISPSANTFRPKARET
jgi:hypothetical protein